MNRERTHGHSSERVSAVAARAGRLVHRHSVAGTGHRIAGARKRARTKVELIREMNAQEKSAMQAARKDTLQKRKAKKLQAKQAKGAQKATEAA